MPKFKMDTLKNIYLDTGNKYIDYLILEYMPKIKQYCHAPGLGKLYSKYQISKITKQALKFSEQEFRIYT